MKLLITGSPGVGKTTIAKAVGKKLKCRVLNELQFALEKKIGKWDVEENELIIPLRRIERALNQELKKEKNLVVEGHTLCETKLNVDFVILIRTDPEILEARLEKKGYKAEKVQDNVFCEGIDYCKKHAERRYRKKKIIEVYPKRTVKETAGSIINELKKRGHK